MAKFVCEGCGERVSEAYYIGDKFLCGKCKPPSPLKKDESPWAEPCPPKFKFVEIDKLPALPENNLAYAIDAAKAEKLTERQELASLKAKVDDLIGRVCELEGWKHEQEYYGKH